MTKLFLKWLPVTIISIAAYGCQSDDPATLTPTDPRGDNYSVAPSTELTESRVASLTDSYQGFAYQTAMDVDDNSENFIYSPLSVYNFLALLANGANGATAAQIANAVNAENPEEIVALCRRQIDSFSNISAGYTAEYNDIIASLPADLDPEIRDEYIKEAAEQITRTTLANSIWFDSNIGIPYQSYVDECRTWLDADANSANFSTPTTPARINQWFSDKTEGMINSIVPPTPIRTEIICTNALYLNAKWQRGFDLKNEKMTFKNVDASTSQVPLLAATGSYKYTETDNAHLVDIPLGMNGEMTFTLLLPKQETTQPVMMFAEVYHIKAKTESKYIKLQIPEYSIETALDENKLKQSLEHQGMTDAFSSKLADFSRMGSMGFSVVGISHAAKINVCESGVEAAAGTANIWFTAPNKPEQAPMELTADRPFAFRITDNQTGMILFLGVVSHL